jgi:AsmA protein
MLTVVLYFVLFVVVVGGCVGAFLMLNPPSDMIRQRIVDAVKIQTGRDLVVRGAASFTLIPDIGVGLRDVSLSAPPGMEGTLVTAEAVEVTLRPMTLLAGRPKIRAITIKRPVFDFRIDRDGRQNWKFASRGRRTQLAQLETPGRIRDARESISAVSDGRQEPASVPAERATHIENVSVRDGIFRFNDERMGRRSEITSANATLSFPSPDGSLSATGDFVWRGQQLDFDGRLGNLHNLSESIPSRLQFRTQNALLSASYDGEVALDSGATLTGQVDAKIPSTRDLAHWFGTVLPPVTGFGPLSIRGKLATKDNVTVFSDAAFALDGQTANGTIKVTTGGARPQVDADLAIDELNLNKYLTSAVTGTLAREGVPDDGGDAAPASDEIERLLQKPATKVYGMTQRAGWSSERMNLALLDVADGNARVKVGRLMFKNMTVGQSAVDVAVADRVMQARFNDVSLYRGRGRGLVTIDGSSGSAKVATNIDLVSISALPLLKDASGFGWLSGDANVKLNLTATGLSQLQLIESLNGSASLQFTNGAVIGFNLPGALRGLAQGNFGGLRTSPSEKTDFSALMATFNVVNGVAQNQDLQIVSPMLRASGGGAVRLPERSLDYTVKPKLVASAEGAASDAEASGIEVPVHITGPWDRPTFRPDLNGVLNDPNKAVDAIKQIGKKLKGKDTNQIVDDLFGKSGEGDPSTEKTKKSAKKLLNKLFGKQDDDAN